MLTNNKSRIVSAVLALAVAAMEKVKYAPQGVKVAVAGVVGSMLAAAPSLATPATPDYAAMITGTKTGFLDIVAQGGPGVFLLLGITAGIGWIFMKVRSVAH